ncbi:MAG: sulfate adenylyltransferase [Acidobacteria bacterium]|nr:MAG: sulfate adenylyltransferase [Acidobacteriota bacterium]
MPTLEPPHGGTLVNLVVPHKERDLLAEFASGLKSKELDEREFWDLGLLATGAYSPLRGFVTERDYNSILAGNRLDSGLIWTLPITLSATETEANRLSGEEEIALTYGDAGAIAIMRIEDVYKVDPVAECEAVFKSADPAHPGAKVVLEAGEYRIGGELQVLDEPAAPFPGFPYTPTETRAEFERRNWSTIVAFQTRNPVHRAHEYLCKCALELVDGLMLHPLVGATKEDDIPADVRMRCYEVLFEKYFPQDRAIIACLPAPMRYAGPKEAIHHALIRRNYGATHFIVGRDHAGVGDYYGTYEAQLFFDNFDPAELGITPLMFEHAFFCRACNQMGSDKTCPHGPDERVHLSGTKVREMLGEGESPPGEFSRPEVAEVLVEAYARR